MNEEYIRHLVYSVNSTILIKILPNHAKYMNMDWVNTSRFWHLKLIELKKYKYIIKEFYKE
jgi:hypothetical protein